MAPSPGQDAAVCGHQGVGSWIGSTRLQRLPRQGRRWRSCVHDLGLGEVLVGTLTHPVKAETPKAGPTQERASAGLPGGTAPELLEGRGREGRWPAAGGRACVPGQGRGTLGPRSRLGQAAPPAPLGPQDALTTRHGPGRRGKRRAKAELGSLIWRVRHADGSGSAGGVCGGAGIFYSSRRREAVGPPPRTAQTEGSASQNVPMSRTIKSRRGATTQVDALLFAAGAGPAPRGHPWEGLQASVRQARLPAPTQPRSAPPSSHPCTHPTGTGQGAAPTPRRGANVSSLC